MLGGLDLDLVDLRVGLEQFVGAVHQLGGDLTVEVGLPALLVREGVEDAECGLVESEREPRRRLRFGLRGRERGLQKLRDLLALFRLPLRDGPASACSESDIA